MRRIAILLALAAAAVLLWLFAHTEAAGGQMQPWQPQPYAVLDIKSRLFHDPASVETELRGSGVQRRYKIGDVTFDRAHGLLYVLELFADDAKPVVHVWRVQ